GGRSRGAGVRGSRLALLPRARELLYDAVVARNELRGVEPVVRLAEELQRRDAVLGQSGPAEGHVQVLRRQPLAELRAEALRIRQSGLGEEGELVAADPRKLVVVRDDGAECIREAA